MKGRKREEKIPADPPTCLLPELSAEEVHKNILRCFRLRNRVDLKLLGWIKVLLEGNHARALGSRTPVQYIKQHLHYGQTEAYQVLKVAASLPKLPLTASAFEKGAISTGRAGRNGSNSSSRRRSRSSHRCRRR